ncbi:MAG: thiopurine S-methyltransferase [Gammaproteobacteria bacterium]
MVNQVEFWQQRWVNNQTGFHEGQVNSYLEKYITRLSLPDNGTVFLPLCGKSNDILWLSNLGYNVIGVECSELAVSAFFSENNLTANITEHDNFKIWQAGNITIYCGDFYELKSSWLTSVNAIFDRAALVALPQEQRDTYINHLKSICSDSTILLVSLEYLQNEMTGPPYAVSEIEIMALLNPSSAVTLIESNDILVDNEKFKERGLTSLMEKVFIITPK